MSLELVLAVLGAIASCIIPFILFGMRSQNEKISKMEERIFHMNGSHVTKQELKEELKQLEERVSQTVSDKLELVNKNIESIKELLLIKLGLNKND